MREEREAVDTPFRPLRPASRPRLIAAFLLGPPTWLLAALITGWIFEYTDAIELGLAVALGSFVVSALVLLGLRRGRRREARRYADRA